MPAVTFGGGGQLWWWKVAQVSDRRHGFQLAEEGAVPQKDAAMDKLALLSVSDKRGLIEFATALVNRFGYRLLSTGGTAKLLAERGLPVTEVSQHTGFPEIMEGRVKTLHPKIHGGLLCRRDKPDHLRQAEVISRRS